MNWRADTSSPINSPSRIRWKILVGGMGGVGKTTFLMRYLTQKFVPDTLLTIGVQFHSKLIEKGGKAIELVIWDLGGQERFRFLQDDYMRGGVGALLMFDLSRVETLHQCVDWVNILREKSNPDLPIVLVGGKVDLVDAQQQQARDEDAKNFIHDMRLVEYIATSSKTGKNVEETINRLVEFLLKKMHHA